MPYLRDVARVVRLCDSCGLYTMGAADRRWACSECGAEAAWNGLDWSEFADSGNGEAHEA